jgi:hypothetical protein
MIRHLLLLSLLLWPDVLPLDAQVPAPAPAPTRALPVTGHDSRLPARPPTDPLELRVVPGGRLLRVELADGAVLYARMVRPGSPYTLALADGGVTEVPSELVRSVREVSGWIQGSRFWPEPGHEPGLLVGEVTRHLLPSPGEDAFPLPAGAHPLRSGTVAATHAHRLLPGRWVLASAVLTPPDVPDAVMVGTRAELLRTRTLDLGAELRLTAGTGRQLGALALVEVRAQATPRTRVSAVAGAPSLVGAGVRHRVSRRWGGSIEALALPGQGYAAAGAVRYLAGPWAVDAGISRSSAGGAGTWAPVLGVVHHRE